MWAPATSNVITVRDSDYYAWGDCNGVGHFIAGFGYGFGEPHLAVATADQNFWHLPENYWLCSK